MSSETRKRKIKQAIAQTNRQKTAVHKVDRFETSATVISSRYRQGPRFITLRARGLTEIPDEIYDLQQVMTLDLENNRLYEVPPRLSKIPSLKWILLAGNPIQHLPEGLGATLVIDIDTYFRCRGKHSMEGVALEVRSGSTLESITALIADLSKGGGPRKLRLSTNESGPRKRLAPSVGMQKLLDALGNFHFVEFLLIRDISLSLLPQGIRNMHGLSELYLSNVGLEELPEWLDELPLQRLSAINNHLKTLPQSLAKMTRLTSLNLSSNPLFEIPAPVFKLTKLEHLSLHNCRIAEIPADLLRLKHLKMLDVLNNSLRSPPPEVADNGLDAIQSYLRQKLDTGVDYLAEAKLIILGEGGAGKTSLAKKIVDESYQLNESQNSTEGIDVIRYSFPTLVRRRDGGVNKPLEREFQVNIWDFGGQEIYHATHQFFLTRRSVYVLVCDNRAEDTDFSYWLNIVKLLSDASPLLIIQNEKHDRSRPVDKSSLSREFGNLCDVLPTNLKDNRGLKEVILAIQVQLERLPHVGVGLPATWKRVREWLENDKRDYIELADYLEICEHHGFKEQKDKLQLSEYLHDLGICLHFQHDPILKHYVILKPSWGTDAVYRVLDDREVIAMQGRFTVMQLNNIWSEEKYEGMRDQLIQLMTKFQLCYKLDNQEAYIAPQLLPVERPAYNWPASGSVVLRYEYDFMPKGIITRFIVAQHRRIHNELVWKTGIVLHEAGTQAEVIEEYARRRITVRVTGPDCRGLLAIVNDQLERIHEFFHHLSYKRYLPCPCAKCQREAEPRLFSINDLVNAASEGVSIQCYGSMKPVDAAGLLRNVLPSALVKEDPCIDSDAMLGDETVEPPRANEVYVSYAWAPESEAFVDQLGDALKQEGITLLRDKSEVRYKDSIREFMQRLGRGDCIIVVISDTSLKSLYCMYELLEIERNAGIRARIFPVVLQDANIFDPVVLIDYIQHWEDQYEVLDEKLKRLKGHGLKALHEALNQYAEIRRLFSGIITLLSDMNTLSSDRHLQSGFKDLIAALRAQLES